MRGQQTEADRIAELTADPQCKQFDAHRCLCAACGRWVHLSGRAHKIFNWRRHKKGCTPQKARGTITIIQSKTSPTMASKDLERDELDDRMGDDEYSSYSNSDEGHGDHRIFYVDQHYKPSARERANTLNRISNSQLGLPTISTSSLSASEASTPPLSSSGVSTASESAYSFHTFHRGVSSTSVSSLPLPPPINTYPYQRYHSSHKSEGYDASYGPRVNCEACYRQLDLSDWASHRRICKSRASSSSLYSQAQSSHGRSSPLSLDSTSRHMLAPITNYAPSSYTSSPTLREAVAHSHSSMTSSLRLPSLGHCSRPSSPYGSCASNSPRTPHSADPYRRPGPPRSIADLCNPDRSYHRSSSSPSYDNDGEEGHDFEHSSSSSQPLQFRTSSSRSSSRSDNSTPTPHATSLRPRYSYSRSTQVGIGAYEDEDSEMRDRDDDKGSWWRSRSIKSKEEYSQPPSPTASHGFGSHRTSSRAGRSFSPPSPFASDSEA